MSNVETVDELSAILTCNDIAYFRAANKDWRDACWRDPRYIADNEFSGCFSFVAHDRDIFVETPYEVLQRVVWPEDFDDVQKPEVKAPLQKVILEEPSVKIIPKYYDMYTTDPASPLINIYTMFK